MAIALEVTDFLQSSNSGTKHAPFDTAFDRRPAGAVLSALSNESGQLSRGVVSAFRSNVG
jgi:hypothetical protein